ncbi:hypothetical protein [Tetragenococcus halophilus]|nr:hypothetical protein [Tetragenococcus halophilus]GMG69188.1 hypothetical protein TEHMS4_21250 [Tetragenococcus halophilus]
MRRDLFLRTDVLPDELPILFSNKNVYLNFSERAMLNDYKDLLNEVTVPLFFYIPKNEGAENRKISLVHPVAQLQMFQYVIQFEELITAHSKKTQFSVRAPQKRNFPKLLSNKKLENEYKKIQQEYGFVERFPITRDEDFSFFYN